jgi:ATP-dependent protease HslVU (ClpYQ) peptidase subunit
VIGARIRDALREAGMLQSSDGMENTGGVLVIGTPDGHLYVMCEFLSVTDFTERGYVAVGSGSHYALGALAVTNGNPARRAAKAIQTAALFDGGTNARVYTGES